MTICPVANEFVLCIQVKYLQEIAGYCSRAVARTCGLTTYKSRFHETQLPRYQYNIET